MLGAQRFASRRERLRAQDLQWRVRAGEARALAAQVHCEARLDIERDAGISAAVPAGEEIEPPAGAHAARRRPLSVIR